MEKAETRDFMNVDSFSQLPFIRPTPPKDKPPLRLFGIEVQNPTTTTTTQEDNNNNKKATQVEIVDAKEGATTSDTTNSGGGGGGGGGSSRKFECHYCCRNFPTSQALGGHQNAHKRERQHAKRAYLQSAAMLHPSTASDHHHLYANLLNYHPHRVGPTHFPSSSSSFTSTNYHLNRYYPTSTTTTSSSYHSYPSHHHHHHHHQAPINGSPLAMWRIPAGSSNRDRSLLQHQYPPPPPPPPHPLTHPHPPLGPLLGGNSGSVVISDDKSKGNQISHGHYLLDQPNKGLQDHVSLDLHL